MIEDQKGYRFSFRKANKNGEGLWRCTKHKSQNCKAIVNTKDGLIIFQKRAHTHES
jgi:hypothetical protein